MWYKAKKILDVFPVGVRLRKVADTQISLEVPDRHRITALLTHAPLYRPAAALDRRGHRLDRCQLRAGQEGLHPLVAAAAIRARGQCAAHHLPQCLALTVLQTTTRCQSTRSYAVEEPLTITSFALSLLLVFRTNASYGRFAEARQIWGLLLNRSRDLVRQAIAFYPTHDWDAKGSLSRWTMMFSKSLLCHLRANSSLRVEASQVLSKQEMQILLACEHPVVMVLQVCSLQLEKMQILLACEHPVVMVLQVCSLDTCI